MSLEAAIGQIDQILQLQQQIFDPSSATGTASSTSAAGGAATGTGTAGGSASSFADMLAGAQQPGSSATSMASDLAGLSDPLASSATGPLASSATGPLSSGVTDPISSGLTDPILSGTTVTGGASLTGTTAGANAPAQLQAMVTRADSLVGKPYVWGGGHGSFGPQTGYDCSGFVSAVLHAGGYLSAPQDTQTLPSQPGIEAGPGQYVTIYDRTDAGMGDDHVIIDLGGQFYESGGEHGAWGGGGGVAKIATPPASYLATFNDVLHPEGM